jgi:purine nucleosidase
MTRGQNPGVPLLLDVDTGIDDALAIAYAVESGVRLVGVSAVAGNVPIDDSTRNSRSVLSWLGAESVPVHRGASRPLAVPYRDAAHVHGDNGLGGADLGESRAPESQVNGVQAILDAAKRYKGELVVAAVGPLTNLAMAISLVPDLVTMVRRVVVMSGAFCVPGNVTPRAEFNAFADPHAAQQVMSAKWNELVAVGLDVTHQTAISRTQWKALDANGSASADLVRRITGRTFTERGMKGLFLHDPLAVAVALDASLVTTEPRDIVVQTDGDERGNTTPVSGGNVRVAFAVDAERFESQFSQLLKLPA